MSFANINGVNIEIPRHVHKPGEYKVVSTEQELTDAFADGWVLRLTEPVDAADATETAPVVDETAGTPEAFVAHIADLSAKDAIAEIEASTDVEALKALAKAEKRATVEKAIERRLDELKA